MTETYLRIFSNSKQEVGLPELTAEEKTTLNLTASNLVLTVQAGAGTCCGDGNENAKFFQTQPGNVPGYACCDEEYNANAWLYPYDIDNLQFTVNLGSGVDPCNDPFGGKGGMQPG